VLESRDSKVQRFVEFCILHRYGVVITLSVVTAILAYFACLVDVRTKLDDLMPRSHPYMAIHEKYKQTFGGSNVVSIMVEVEKGDIFNQATLSKVQKITRDLQKVDAVNPFQITSIASKKLKDVHGTTDGIDFTPIMWPSLPRDEPEMLHLREAVLNNPIVYGAYVSLDLKAALITVDFYDHLVDYDKVFKQVTAIVDENTSPEIRVRVVGEPVLFGWVQHYLPETLKIFALTIFLLVALLFITARSWRGTILPLLAGAVSSIWALGAARLLGFNVDPLVIVVAFLITARAISHSVQLVTRFEDELRDGAQTSIAAARASMSSLFKPGMLGVIADAGCMIVVLLTPITLMHKVAIIGTIWVLTISVSAVVLTPVLLTWVNKKSSQAHSIDLAKYLQIVLNLAIYTVATRARIVVLSVTAVVFILSGLYAFNLKVGDANPGSPILWPDSRYNTDAQAVNQKFQGSDRMFVVFHGAKDGALKDPAVLENISNFQRFMSAQPEIGGTLSIADLLPAVQRTVREGNPRYLDIGNSSGLNGELYFMLVNGAEPGDISRFVDSSYKDGSVTLFFKDHTGETIRTAVSRVKEFADKQGIPQGEYQLAGGLVGVLASINEVLLSGQIESIAFALLVLVICCMVAYRSAIAGMFFMVPVLLSNTLTFSFMAAKGIGMNINTVPVAALGIGLGVDYAFYIVDSIKEELEKNPGSELLDAIRKSLNGAGRGVLVTAFTLIISVVFWCFSSLRFQAEMGLLMAIWLLISSFSALFIVPAMVYLFRPKFVVGKNYQHSTRSTSAMAVAGA
jgi:predicted RND superfamily exporter protein